MDVARARLGRMGEENRTMDAQTNEALAAVLQLLAKLYRFPADDATVSALQELATQTSRRTAEHALDTGRDRSTDGEGDAAGGDPFMQDKDFAEGVRMFAGSFESSEPAAARLAAKNDFHKLFVGPLTLLAAPWSTVYLDGGMLFGPTEHEVREEFHRQGFDIPEGTREPCDHIAYELQFLAEMHKRATGLATAGIAPDPHGASASSAPQPEALGIAREFRRRFVDPWAADFLAKVGAGARADTYRGLALMTRGALRVEEGALEAALRAA